MFKDRMTYQCLIELLLHHFPNNKFYVVGGAIRDLVMEKPIKDIDIATDVLPVYIDNLNGLDENTATGNYSVYTTPTGIKHGTVTVSIMMADGQHEHFEITTMRTDQDCDGRHAEVKFSTDIVDDLARRDFTINAMAMDVTNDQIVDLHGGLKDCTTGLIACVGDAEKRFQEDYLRIIRAARFCGYHTKMHISELTLAAGKKYGHKIPTCITKERIRMEILKMMETPHPEKCIQAMLDMDILRYVLPHVNACLVTPGGPHHNETVYEHLIGTMIHLPADRPLLRLVGLLHDVGKAPSCEIKPTGISFYNHEVLGARIAYEWARQFKFSREECEYISLMVRHHMFHFEEDTKKKAIKRWLRKVGKHYEDLFLLRQADRAGNRAKAGRPLVTVKMTELAQLIEEIETTKEPMKITDLAINGTTLIEKFGLKPGILFGKILKVLLDRVLEDPTLNTAEKLEAMIPDVLQHINDLSTAIDEQKEDEDVIHSTGTCNGDPDI